ncbi:MAG: alpha/beta hydrolase [Alphaproteobacteria bacterium]|nr:alpha/beta hydrolase [Alphaproteobacteria bacterium]
MCFNFVLRIGRARYRFGDTIFKTRSNYSLLAKTIYFLSRRPKDVRVDHTPVDGIAGVRLIPQNKSSRVILYIYGGSFVMELKVMKYPTIPFAATLAKAAHAEVWIPEYRVAPEYGFPSQGEDCFVNYMSLINRGIKPQDITIMGTGSGAALALGLVLQLRDRKRPLPGSIVTISAWTDFAMTANSLHERAELDPVFNPETLRGYFSHYLQGADPTNPMASPFYGDYKDFPPMYMMVGGREIFYDDTIRTAEKAKAAGVDVTLDVNENMIFSYPIYYEFIDEGKAAIDRIGSFVRDNHDINREPSPKAECCALAL